jgi:hypothetical protein
MPHDGVFHLVVNGPVIISLFLTTEFLNVYFLLTISIRGEKERMKRTDLTYLTLPFQIVLLPFTVYVVYGSLKLD